MKAFSRWAVPIAVIAVAACKSGSSSAGSPTAPTADGGGLPGPWSGTITRPGGQPPITVSWHAGAQNTDDANTGPMTLTNNGVSITVPGRAAASGNNANGYDIHFSINANAGDVAGFPSCSVRASPSGALPRFTAPYKTIAITLQISYAGCNAFIEPPPLSNFLQETGQLNISKP